MYDINYTIAFFLNTYCKQTGNVIEVVLFVLLSLFISELMLSRDKSAKTQSLFQATFSILLLSMLAVIVLITIEISPEARSNYHILLIVCLVTTISIAILILLLIFLLSDAQSSKIYFIFVTTVAILVPIVLNVVMLFLPQMYSIQKTLFRSAKFDPIFVAERGNTHLAAENTVESVLAIARRMYAKRISLDVVMTKDGVLVGHKANDLKYFNQSLKIYEHSFAELKRLQIGKYWLEIDPYGVFHNAKYQLKSYEAYLQEIYEFQQKVENSHINTLDELIAVCMRYLIPFNLNLVLNQENEIQYSNKLIESLGNFGLTSVDRAHLFKLKTNSFQIY